MQISRVVFELKIFDDGKSLSAFSSFPLILPPPSPFSLLFNIIVLAAAGISQSLQILQNSVFYLNIWIILVEKLIAADRLIIQVLYSPPATSSLNYFNIRGFLNV